MTSLWIALCLYTYYVRQQEAGNIGEGGGGYGSVGVSSEEIHFGFDFG